MDLVSRVKGILLDPKAEWPIIEREPADTAGLLKNYVAILAAIPAVCGFIGSSIIGIGPFRTPLFTGLGGAIIGYLLTFVGVFVLAFVIDALAVQFGGRRSFESAMKVSAYSPTAAWLAGVFSAIPVLSILSVLGLYTFYLLYTGLPALMKVPQERSLGYLLAIIVCAIIVWLLILVVPTMILGTRLF